MTIAGLTDQQAAAVRSDARAILVNAGAGSGKTEVVAQRVERLLAESRTSTFRVLALSYTVKAAEELRRRFASRLGDLQRRVETDTVHGFAHSLLRQHGSRVGLPVEPEVLARDEDRAELLTRWLAAEGEDPPKNIADALRSLDVARARQSYDALRPEWERALDAYGALDYPRMLEKATELLELPSARRQIARLYGHIIVDEAQNLTKSQYTLLATLIGEPRGEHVPTMLVGDDKQSIVSFAGADPRLMRQFEQAYNAERHELSVNFRSAARLVDLGNAVAGELDSTVSSQRHPTSYAAAGVVEIAEYSNEEEEGAALAQWASDLLANGLPRDSVAEHESRTVRPPDIAILGRSAGVLRSVRSALAAAGLEAAWASSPEDWLATTSGKVASELVALRSAAQHRSTYWQLARLLDVSEDTLRSPHDVAAVLDRQAEAPLASLGALCELESPAGLINYLEGIHVGTAGSDDLANWEADLTQLRDAWSGFESQTDQSSRTWGNFRQFITRLQRGDDSEPGVRLLTIHKAQGREFRAVAVPGLNDGQLPDFRAKAPADRAAELRTFYVAVTRPSRALLLTRAKSRQTRYGQRSTTASPFLGFARPHSLGGRDPRYNHGR